MRLLACLAFSLALAQVEPIETLCVMTQGVVSQSLAEDIRRAAVERGVKVYILVPPDLVQTPASYIPGLSLLDTVQVRVLEHQENFVIQDQSRVFELSESLLPVNTNISGLYSYFVEQWEKGRDYRFLPRVS